MHYHNCIYHIEYLKIVFDANQQTNQYIISILYKTLIVEKSDVWIYEFDNYTGFSMIIITYPSALFSINNKFLMTVIIHLKKNEIFSPYTLPRSSVKKSLSSYHKIWLKTSSFTRSFVCKTID
jgi:hypothetical protein